MLNIGVLVSGRGSNMQAIIDAIKKDELCAKIKVVISNKAKILAKKRAEKENIPFIFISPKQYRLRENYDRKIIEYLEKYDVQLVVLAGYMRIISPYFIQKYRYRIMNIHPSLLPSFPGEHAHKDTLTYGVKVSGCTVHFVDEGIDTGPIILQTPVLVHQDDDEESLSERILQEEHKLYPYAIKLFGENKLIIEGRKVKIKEE